MQDWYLYSIICLVASGLWGFFAKLAHNNGLGARTVMAVSVTVTFLLTGLFLLLSKHRFDKAPMGMLFALLVGISAFIAGIFFYMALEDGKSSIVMVITALYPAITVLLGWLVLHEELTLIQSIGVVLGIAAAVMMAL